LAKNIIHLKPTGDYHAEIDQESGGIIDVDDYEIVLCDVDLEHGNFDYVIAAPLIKFAADAPKSKIIHVSKLHKIGDPEIQQLRSEGVEVVILSQ